MSIKFNEEDFISFSEFKCEQDYNDFVKAVESMGYNVYNPHNYDFEATDLCDTLVFEDGNFEIGYDLKWGGKSYKLKEIVPRTLPEEAQALRKMFLQAVKDVEEGRLTSIDEFLGKL